ncbi:MAG: Mrp/NBP35 family ATP-binding protein [Bacteroidales bacterium]|nr:Mrp/NBP35 family ATP-binding protein [Bacteroidales bacterium]
MAYKEEQILEVLKNVLYFPKGDNIVSLKMVQDIKQNGSGLSFTLIFPESNDKTIPIVRQSCVKALKENLGLDVDPVKDIIIKGADEIGGKAPLQGVKNIIAVASGKGGVGKSTVSANLAIALAKTGAKVGLFDADVYGPSVPVMFDLVNEKPGVYEENGKTIIVPIEKYGIKVLSLGFFVEPDKALIWRGSMATSALKQMLFDADWGDLDYMVLDLPPGTGDIHLTMVQELPITGSVIVTTPQEVALADARKAFGMFRQEQINVPIVGLIENMSYFTPAELPENKYYIFGQEGGKKLAKEYDVNFLGQIPLVQGICESGDAGAPIVMNEDSPLSKAFVDVANNVIKNINVRNETMPATKKVEITTH